MPPSKITPDWIKAQKNMTDAMKELEVKVKAIDTHFVGMALSKQAQKAQDGPFKKALTNVRTDSKMVRNALQANKTKKNKDEVKIFQDIIDDMFSEDIHRDNYEIWSTSKGIKDQKKIDFHLKKSLKKWRDEEKKVKDKMVKKILSKSKTPAFLVALAKTLPGVFAAKDAFRGHYAKFAQANLFLGQGLDKVTKELPKVTAALKKIKAGAEEMEKIAF